MGELVAVRVAHGVSAHALLQSLDFLQVEVPHLPQLEFAAIADKWKYDVAQRTLATFNALINEFLAPSLLKLEYRYAQQTLVWFDFDNTFALPPEVLGHAEIEERANLITFITTTEYRK